MIGVPRKDTDKTRIRTKPQVLNRLLGTRKVEKMRSALKLGNRNHYPSPSSKKAVETCLKLSMSTL